MKELQNRINDAMVSLGCLREVVAAFHYTFEHSTPDHNAAILRLIDAEAVRAEKEVCELLEEIYRGYVQKTE